MIPVSDFPFPNALIIKFIGGRINELVQPFIYKLQLDFRNIQ